MNDPVVAIQQGLEALYRVDSQLDVRDFLLTRRQRDALWPASGRRPAEQLFIRQEAASHPEGSGWEELELALYLDEEVLATLRAHDPRRGLSGRNLGALLLVLEGISHFIYTAVRARAQRPVSALELELQAEVDKYVALLLLLWPRSDVPLSIDLPEDAPGELPDWLPDWLIDRLFQRVVFDAALSAEEQTRYQRANAAAASYARALRRRYPLRAAHHDLPGLLREVRHFWRLSCADKLSHIDRRP